ncbi:MAG: NAD(P)-dependent oxidoreductase [Candidatus Latescibacterota bacterium]|nr:NAD(P)-dependent oxidoreductase [Candidatus Latescibacterota bacterium]
MKTADPHTLPDHVETIDALDDLLSRPSPALVADLAQVEGDILVLGASGKVGPTLTRMAKRAAPSKRIVAVARFTDPEIRNRLDAWGVETIGCDLFDRDAVARLPRLPNVVFMVGRKFSTTGQEGLTWATNVYLPGIVAEVFADARIVAFSTLCVYPFADIAGPGWDEAAPVGPVGEYANSCVGRERVFQHCSARYGTPGRLVRLNYAIDLRYGVLHEVASRVWWEEPIDVSMPRVNIIWQGDATAQILRALRHCTAPTSPLNIGGPDHVALEDLASIFAERFGKQPVFKGRPANTAWINNTAQATRLFGPPTVALDQMVAWTAEWVARDRPNYGKPTRCEVRDGRF